MAIVVSLLALFLLWRYANISRFVKNAPNPRPCPSGNSDGRRSRQFLITIREGHLKKNMNTNIAEETDSKVALVTGGSRSIGAAIAKRLALMERRSP